ncbi:hypothetical protein FACS1894152_6440 [Bacilli bacterium]|nr:hypothetical protein FACS1894152_6440 [Bacilli bacterium]GHU31290.1 hypothetical protein FACS1894166_02450 [Bacilli bacterium]
MKAMGKKLVHPKEKDLYIVCFTTKETRNGQIDKPRCIECEVTNTRVDKKN